MGSFQELPLIILSLFASLKLMSAFIHETFLNWRQLKIVRRQSTLSYVILINSWKLLSENAQSPTPLKKSTPPLKIQKVEVLLPFGQHYTFFSSRPPPPPNEERVGGHHELAFLLLVILFSIADLDVIYFLRKIFPPSEVLEVFIYSHLQCFLRGKFSQWEGGKSWVMGIWQGVILTTWIFLKDRDNIL